MCNEVCRGSKNKRLASKYRNQRKRNKERVMFSEEARLGNSEKKSKREINKIIKSCLQKEYQVLTGNQNTYYQKKKL